MFGNKKHNPYLSNYLYTIDECQASVLEILTNFETIDNLIR